MTPTVLPSSSSYEVVLDGTLGPVYLARVEALGVGRAVTTSTFLVTVPGSAGIGETLTRLTARGLVVLGVRQVPESRAVASTTAGT